MDLKSRPASEVTSLLFRDRVSLLATTRDNAGNIWDLCAAHSGPTPSYSEQLQTRYTKFGHQYFILRRIDSTKIILHDPSTHFTSAPYLTPYLDKNNPQDLHALQAIDQQGLLTRLATGATHTLLYAAARQSYRAAAQAFKDSTGTSSLEFLNALDYKRLCKARVAILAHQDRQIATLAASIFEAMVGPYITSGKVPTLLPQTFIDAATIALA